MIVGFGVDHNTVLTDEPVFCGECGTMRSVWVNRDGQSRCFFCDHARQIALCAVVRAGCAPARMAARA